MKFLAILVAFVLLAPASASALYDRGDFETNTSGKFGEEVVKENEVAKPVEEDSESLLAVWIGAGLVILILSSATGILFWRSREDETDVPNYLSTPPDSATPLEAVLLISEGYSIPKGTILATFLDLGLRGFYETEAVQGKKSMELKFKATGKPADSLNPADTAIKYFFDAVLGKEMLSLKEIQSRLEDLKTELEDKRNYIKSYEHFQSVPINYVELAHDNRFLKLFAKDGDKYYMLPEAEWEIVSKYDREAAYFMQKLFGEDRLSEEEIMERAIDKDNIRDSFKLLDPNMNYENTFLKKVDIRKKYDEIAVLKSMKDRWEAVEKSLEAARTNGTLLWEKNWVRKAREAMMFVAVVSTLGLFAALIALSAPFWTIFFATLGFSVILVLIFEIIPERFLNKMSPDTNLRRTRWQAFARWTRDFPRLQDTEPASIKIWQEILVYAVAFGTAQRMIETGAIPALVEQESLAVETIAFSPDLLNGISYGIGDSLGEMDLNIDFDMPDMAFDLDIDFSGVLDGIGSGF